MGKIQNIGREEYFDKDGNRLHMVMDESSRPYEDWEITPEIAAMLKDDEFDRFVLQELGLL